MAVLVWATLTRIMEWGVELGTCIGLNAAFLNIISEWLSDIKQGHCTTAFYLNENFCCWGADHGAFKKAKFLLLPLSLGIRI